MVSVHHTKTASKVRETIVLARMPLLTSAYRRSARNCDEFEVNKDALLSLGSDEARFERDVANAVEKALTTIHSLGFVQVDVSPENVYVDSEGRFYLGVLGNGLPLAEGQAGRRFAPEYHALELPSSSATSSPANTAAAAAEPHVCFAAFRHVALDGRNPLGADLTKLIVELQELGVTVRHLWAGNIDDYALEVLEGSLDPNDIWQSRNYASDELATFAADIDQNHLDSVVIHCELAGSPWLIEAYGDRVMLVNVPASRFGQMRDVLLRWSDDLVEVGHATASPAV